MVVRLNVVKSTITPQIRTAKNVSKQSHRIGGEYLARTREMKILKDMGGVDPKASDKDGHMAKHTLGGMATGAGVGAAVGSIVPVVGTAFGAMVGGVLGALGGATVGLFR